MHTHIRIHPYMYATSHDRYLKYCLHMVDMMVHYKVIPVLVFDGARLPSKSGTETDRHDRRRENLAKARQLLTVGDRSGADEHFRKAVDITPQMAHSLIEELRKRGIEYIVAPYEADAQLAYLAKSGYVSCVVTEDSDLIPYGSPRILFKMDKFGEGMEYRIENLGVNRELDFKNFTPDMLVRMCILSGCDYLDSLPGIGLKTAHKIVKEHKTLPNVCRYVCPSVCLCVMIAVFQCVYLCVVYCVECTTHCNILHIYYHGVTQ